MIKPAQNYMNLKESAEYLGVSYALVKRDYPLWVEKFGIKVYAFPGRVKRIKKADLDKIVQGHSVTL